MKPITRIILIIIIVVLMMTAVTISDPGQTTDQNKPVQYSITEVVDGSFTPPNIYEIHFRITSSNGLIIDRWTDVSKKEYERIIDDESD